MTAPNPPPRGGAQPRVSDARLAQILSYYGDFGVEAYNGTIEGDAGSSALDLRDARAECADLRAKLEAAEAERDEQDRFTDKAVKERNAVAARLEKALAIGADNRARAEAAEAALREMTEQRDGAWEAGRDAAADLVIKTWRECTRDGDGRLERLAAKDAIAALAPPAETAAKEERT